MKKGCLFILAILFTQCLFAQDIHYSENVPVEEIRVALQHAKGGYADEIYDEIEYIPLETTKESTIQNIRKLWVTDQYFIILDVFGRQILFFDKQGKYIRKINKIPNCERCKSFKLLIDDAKVDVENKAIYAHIAMPTDDGSFNVKFDFDGNYFGGQSQLNDMTDFSFIKNSLVSYHSPRGIQEERNFTMLSILGDDKNNNIISYDSLASINEDEYEDNSRNFSIPSTQDSILYFTRPYDYNVYELGTNGLHKVYKFIFPLQYSIPHDFITNKEYNGKRETMLSENNSWITTLDYIRRHKDYLIFNAESPNTSNSQFAYNLSTGTLLDFEKVTPNNFNNNFRLRADLDEYILASDDDYMYKSIMPVILLNTAQESKFRYTNDPDGKMKKTISGLTNFSNPVLVRLKIKDDL